MWDAIRDIGALHTRLVPGFVVDTRIEPGARVLTFGNGMVMREPIVTIDEESRRLARSAAGGRTTHYNASAQVFVARTGQTKVVWIADFCPMTLPARFDPPSSRAPQSCRRRWIGSIRLRRNPRP